MRPTSDVRRVFELRDQGCSKSEIARQTGVSRSQVRGWLAVGIDAVLQSPLRARATASGGEDGALCRASRFPFVTGVNERAYAYLLGQYLGDGMLSLGPRAVFRLRISMCDAYPGIMAEGVAAIRAVMPANRVCAIPRIGCTEIVSYSKHWICLFPQHGAGRKHLRPIVLQPWQQRIALDEHPRQLLRGLIHSDGCRIINWVMGRDKDGLKRYTYPRYLFSNESADIRGIFVEACHRVGVEWSANRRNMISVARGDSVRLLDAFIGPKS
jgi:Helix-turn-helix domain of resolvase